jgi:hypothetical protein
MVVKLRLSHCGRNKERVFERKLARRLLGSKEEEVTRKKL